MAIAQRLPCFVPEARGAGGVAVADVPGLDLLQHPRRDRCRDEADADLERQHHERRADRAETLADRGADHVAVHRERERVVRAVGELRLALEPRPHLDARGAGLEVGVPRARSRRSGRQSVCSWKLMCSNGPAAEAFGRLGDLELVRARERRGTARRGSRARVSCAMPNTPCARSASLPSTRRSAATCDAVRPSRSTSTSIVIGPGGTGARKIALAVTSVSSGRPSASCIARNAVYMRDAAEHVHDLPVVGDVGVEAAGDRRVGGERGVGAEVAGAFGHRVSLGSAHAQQSKDSPVRGRRTLMSDPRSRHRSPPTPWDDETRALLGDRSAQHLRDARAPPEADEALDGVRQPRARQEHAVGTRSRAAHPAHRLELPRALRVGPARRDRAGASASPTRRSQRVAAGPDAPGWDPFDATPAARGRRAAHRPEPHRRDLRRARANATTSSNCSTSCSPSGSTTWCRWR